HRGACCNCALEEGPAEETGVDPQLGALRLEAEGELRVQGAGPAVPRVDEGEAHLAAGRARATRELAVKVDRAAQAQRVVLARREETGEGNAADLHLPLQRRVEDRGGVPAQRLCAAGDGELAGDGALLEGGIELEG